MEFYFYNTANRGKDIFKPLGEGRVLMYHCGPTVYDYVHIGNLRAYTFADTLRRAFEYAGYSVTQVMNITDFGHLVSDADEGEDKMSAGLRREGKPATMENMLGLGGKYFEIFKKDMALMHIKNPSVFPRASEHVAEQIELIKRLEKKGFVYRALGGVYFDTAAFPEYGKLSRRERSGNTAGARIAVNPEKRNPEDFVVWRSDEKVGWDSPWGKGFPGWHIECSAMSMKYLGETFDIHTGGEDLKFPHHENEIAQSECATGKPFVRYWMHNAFVLVDGAKMAKSTGNVFTLRNIEERGFSPLALRYLYLSAHYRSPLNFTWESLVAAQNALDKISTWFRKLGAETGNPVKTYLSHFEDTLGDDLNTPQALAVLWDMMKDGDVPAPDKRATALAMDTAFGFGIETLSRLEIPEDITHMAAEREEARKQKQWEKADRLRSEIEARGYFVNDTSEGPMLRKL